jgi:hypothetical protein
VSSSPRFISLARGLLVVPSGESEEISSAEVPPVGVGVGSDFPGLGELFGVFIKLQKNRRDSRHCRRLLVVPGVYLEYRREKAREDLPPRFLLRVWI